jgi:hypothetical protein
MFERPTWPLRAEAFVCARRSASARPVLRGVGPPRRLKFAQLEPSLRQLARTPRSPDRDIARLPPGAGRRAQVGGAPPDFRWSRHKPKGTRSDRWGVLLEFCAESGELSAAHARRDRRLDDGLRCLRRCGGDRISMREPPHETRAREYTDLALRILVARQVGVTPEENLPARRPRGPGSRSAVGTARRRRDGRPKRLPRSFRCCGVQNEWKCHQSMVGRTKTAGGLLLGVDYHRATLKE